MVNQAAFMGLSSKSGPVVKNELEQELVQRACEGDTQAFGELYELWVDWIYRYIYYRVSNDLIAEDLTSKVFLKAWEHLPRFEQGDSPFIAWLHRIAHNTVVDHYRQYRPTTDLDEAWNEPSHEELPEAQYERRVQADTLRTALLQLRRSQRDVVTMKLLDGLSTDEIAQRLRKSPGAVRAIQWRALQALAKILPAQQDISEGPEQPL